MYIVFFQKSYTKRYDDAEEMGRDIANWLILHPNRKVEIKLYI